MTAKLLTLAAVLLLAFPNVGFAQGPAAPTAYPDDPQSGDLVLVLAPTFGIARWNPWIDELEPGDINRDPSVSIDGRGFVLFDLVGYAGAVVSTERLGDHRVVQSIGYQLHLSTDGASFLHRHRAAFRASTEHLGLTFGIGPTFLQPYERPEVLHAGFGGQVSIDVHIAEGFSVVLPSLTLDAFPDLGSPLVSVSVGVSYSPSDR